MCGSFCTVLAAATAGGVVVDTNDITIDAIFAGCVGC